MLVGRVWLVQSYRDSQDRSWKSKENNVKRRYGNERSIKLHESPYTVNCRARDLGRNGPKSKTETEGSDTVEPG